MIIQDLFEAPQSCPHCGGPSFSDLILAEKKDACYHKVKASAKVWPSAYASGRLVQCRKKGADNYGNSKNEDVAEAFGPLPREKQQIRLGRHTVDIERVGLDKNYISFAWNDSQGQEHYEEVSVGDLGNYDDLIKRIKQEISYQERQYTDQGVAEGLNEMDKTQTPPGRDGDIDWTKKQIHLGPENIIKAKDVAKHALKALDKTMKKSHADTPKKKGVAETMATFSAKASTRNSGSGEFRGISIPSDMKHPEWREPTWSFQEIAQKLGIPVATLNLLAFNRIGGFPEALSGLSARHGSKKYYKQSEVKRWVNANNVREKLKQGVAETGPAATAAIQQGLDPTEVGIADRTDKYNTRWNAINAQKAQQMLAKGLDPTKTADWDKFGKQGVAEGSLEYNTPDPVVVVQDKNGKMLDKINLSIAAQKYKLGQPQNIKKQLAHQNYTTVGNYVIVSPMSGQPQDATTQGMTEGGAGSGRTGPMAWDTSSGRVGRVEKTASGIRHHADPSRYGGTENEPESNRLDKSMINKMDNALGVKWDRESKRYFSPIKVDEEDVNAGEYDYEGDMAKDDLQTMIRAARRLNNMLDNNENMPEWVQSKINKAADYVDTAADYIESNKEQGDVEMEEGQSKSKEILDVIAESVQDLAVFEIDSEEAYAAVLSRFGNVIDWQGDYMTVPRRYWPAIEVLAHEAGGAAQEVNDEQLNELMFMGMSPCTKDCSGHRAGYEWSKRRGRAHAASWSDSFNRGAAIAASGV